MALMFVTLNESYYSDLNASLTFKVVCGVLSLWLPGPILLLSKTTEILLVISKGASSYQWCQYQLCLLEKLPEQEEPQYM